MHPRAGEFLQQAQAASGSTGGSTSPQAIEVLVNLTEMMEGSVKKAQRDGDYQTALSDLHDQFHALHQAFCQVPEAQATFPFFIQAVTIRREMREVFHRLWDYRDRPMLRQIHLELFGRRVQELRRALQTISG